MCRTDFDEAWECVDSWPSIGTCVDCGWRRPGVHEVYNVVDDLWAEEGEGYTLALELLLNDGVPDWQDEIEWDGWDSPQMPAGRTWTKRYTNPRGDEVSYERTDHPLSDRAQNLAALLPRPDGIHDSHICDCCLEARRWLEEWCQSWMYDDYRSDIIEHWQEDEVPHSLATGRLVVAAKNRWRTPLGGDHTAPEVAVMVDQSLAYLRRVMAS